MCTVTKKQPVADGLCSKRDWTARQISIAAGTTTNEALEIWLGLDKIHRLTKGRSRLWVDLEDFENQTAYAEYDSFGVGDEQSKYKLERLGQYAGKTQHHS